ncbi:MAG: hypothetical protein ACSLE1_00035 [Sphingobium sp.]
MPDIQYGGNGSNEPWTSRSFPKSQIHSTSLSVSPLEIMNADGELFTHGTVFFYKMQADIYFVTAWHVAAGRNFFSRERNPAGLIPTSFRCYLPQFSQIGELLNIITDAVALDLHESAVGKLVEPPTAFGVPVDIAVGKLTVSSIRQGSFTSQGLNEFSWGIKERVGNPIQTMVGADIFVLGYPLKTYEGTRTPIWKRGSLATEPSFAITPKGSFLIDVNSTTGMSGGPIIRRVTTITANNVDLGIVQELHDEMVLGIYSGRALSQSEPSFVLGFGWPIDFVHEIIRTGQCFM